jgi:hypothetical protein
MRADGTHELGSKLMKVLMFLRARLVRKGILQSGGQRGRGYCQLGLGSHGRGRKDWKPWARKEGRLLTRRTLKGKRV